MGSVSSRVSQNASLAYVEHDPSNSEDTWQHIYTSVTTTAGLTTGATLTDTSRVSGSADTYNGRYWVYVKSGANKGLWRRIVNDYGSGIYDLEGKEDSTGLPHQVTDGIEYELWKSPQPLLVVTTGTSETEVRDSERGEADDFWNGYYAVAISGAQRGEKAQITNFANTNGVFTLGSGLSAAPVAGDVFVLCKFIDVTSVSDGLTHAFNPRPAHRLDGSRGDGSVGPRGGTFTVEAPALGVWRNGSETHGTVLGGLFKACGFTEVNSALAGGATLESGSTTTGLEIETATWENYVIGAAVSAGGEQAYITAFTDGGGSADTLTVTPALGDAPTNAVELARTVNYRRNRRADDGDYGCVTLMREVDGIRTTMTGCKGNVTISGEAELMFSFEFQVDHFTREYAPSPGYVGDAYESFAPIQSTERRCYFGSTAVELGGISATLGNVVAPRKVQGAYGANGRAGFGHSGVNPGLTCRKLMSTVLDDELDADERFLARTTHDLMIFWGNNLYGNCAIRIPVARLVAEPKPEDDEGMQVTPFVFEAMQAGQTADPDGTYHNVPDFIISFS